MAVQALALVEPVLKQLRHQGLGLGQGGDALAKVARRQHPQLPAQAPGAAPVVGHGDDGGDIGGIRLDAPQQGGEAGAAADGHDPGALAQLPVAVDDVRQSVLAAGRKQGRQERMAEPPQGYAGEDGTDSQEEEASEPAIHKLQGNPVRRLWEWLGAVEVGHDVGHTQAQAQDTHQKQRQPPLDVHPGPQPLKETVWRHSTSQLPESASLTPRPRAPGRGAPNPVSPTGSFCRL